MCIPSCFRRLACIDPQRNPGPTRKVTILEIAVFALALIALILATQLEQGELATSLLAGGSGVLFILGIALECARRASRQLAAPVSDEDVILAIKLQVAISIERYGKMGKFRELQCTLDDGSKGTALHLLAENNSVTSSLSV